MIYDVKLGFAEVVVHANDTPHAIVKARRKLWDLWPCHYDMITDAIDSDFQVELI